MRIVEIIALILGTILILGIGAIGIFIGFMFFVSKQFPDDGEL